MPTNCGICNNSLSRHKPAISCSGFCEGQFHLSCVGISAEVAKVVESTPGLTWKCSSCLELEQLLTKKQVYRSLQGKLDDFVAEIGGLFERVKSGLVSIADKKLVSFTDSHGNTPRRASYAGALINPSQPAVVIKPKNTQDRLTTKREVLSKFDPLESDVNIRRVKNISDGGILLSCQDAGETTKLRKLAESKLSDRYEVREAKCIHPRVKIVGMTESLDDAALLDYIVKQNDDVFQDVTDCKVVKSCWATKRKNDVYQAILQVSSRIYSRLCQSGYLLVGLDACTVYDAVSVQRCFKCNAFNHIAKNCNADKIVCPRCGENHDVKDCKSDVLRCVNCIGYNKRHHTTHDCGHAVWEYDKCETQRALAAKLRADLNLA